MQFDLRKYGAAADQRAALLADTAEAVKHIRLMRNRVLVATYVEPERTAGGIILTDKRLDESRFQGKVGLVLKIGPMAFVFPDEIPTEAPNVGDWVFYRASDATECGVKVAGTRQGVLCRHIHDDNIVGVINDPELIW